MLCFSTLSMHCYLNLSSAWFARCGVHVCDHKEIAAVNVPDDRLAQTCTHACTKHKYVSSYSVLSFIV